MYNISGVVSMGATMGALEPTPIFKYLTRDKLLGIPLTLSSQHPQFSNPNEAPWIQLSPEQKNVSFST